MRQPIIAGNWKMNKTQAAASVLVDELLPLLESSKAEVVLCVPFTDLSTVASRIKGTKINLGAQNISWADSGAFTGEISGEMLVELGVKYVIIGHSERRQMFGETNKTVNLRTKQALKCGLVPIVCVGETEQQKIDGQTNKIITAQLMDAMMDLSDEDMSRVVVAYEPVWAIGTGKTATAEDANNVCKYIRNLLVKMFTKQVSDAVRIQYGGSMNPTNVAELMAMSDIDGGLIGGASLKANDFAKVVNYK